MATQNTEELDLVDYAKAAADLLLAKHPQVVFTSGRRGVADQCHAMAENVVQSRTYIRDTYVATPQRDQLQKWVDTHPGATNKTAIAAGLLSVMNTWTDKQKMSISRHLSGQAFDVMPVNGAAGNAIKKTIGTLPNLRKFLEKEGGLVRWHADFEA